MNTPGYLLDTNVLVLAYLHPASASGKLLRLGMQGRARLVATAYVVKEVRLVLRRLGLPADKTEGYLGDVLGRNLLILKGASREEVKRSTIRLRDRSDLPLLLPAMKHTLPLVSEDTRLRRDARRYVRVLSPAQAAAEVQRMIERTA